MSGAPRWLRLLACATLAILVIAVIQPAVGGLLLRTFAIGAVLAIGVVGVAVPLRRLVSATATGGPRAVSYTHLTLRRIERCRSRWSPYH